MAVSLEVPEVDTNVRPETFSCDTDSNGKADLGDFIYMLKEILGNRSQPTWDLDNNGRVNISDAIELLFRLFSNRCD